MNDSQKATVKSDEQFDELIAVRSRRNKIVRWIVGTAAAIGFFFMSYGYVSNANAVRDFTERRSITSDALEVFNENQICRDKLKFEFDKSLSDLLKVPDKRAERTDPLTPEQQQVLNKLFEAADREERSDQFCNKPIPKPDVGK